MPWWVVVYLAVFSAVTVGGLFDDWGKPHRGLRISGQIIASLFVLLFITGYFYEEVGDVLGSYIFPMLVAGMALEFFLGKIDLAEKAVDPDLTEKEGLYLNITGLFLAALITLPAYVLGLFLGLRNAGF